MIYDPYSNWERRIESYELRGNPFPCENFRVPHIYGDLEGVYIYMIYVYHMG